MVKAFMRLMNTQSMMIVLLVCFWLPTAAGIFPRRRQGQHQQEKTKNDKFNAPSTSSPSLSSAGESGGSYATPFFVTSNPRTPPIPGRHLTWHDFWSLGNGGKPDSSLSSSSTLRRSGTNGKKDKKYKKGKKSKKSKKSGYRGRKKSRRPHGMSQDDRQPIGSPVKNPQPAPLDLLTAGPTKMPTKFPTPEPTKMQTASPIVPIIQSAAPSTTESQIPTGLLELPTPEPTIMQTKSPIVSIIPSAGPSTTESQNPTGAFPAPRMTGAPTSSRSPEAWRGDTIAIALEPIFGSAFFGDTSSPYNQAFLWLIYDELQVLPSDPNFLQRYVLAVFHISTTNSQPWLSCNHLDGSMDSSCDYQKLTDLFPTAEYEIVPWVRWMSNEHECEWAGVFCDERKHVRAIDLAGQEIHGEFPFGFVFLPFLQSLNLLYNELYGPLPSEVAQMSNLISLELHWNFFSGSIPPEWFGREESRLQIINVGGNLLTGTLPTEISQPKMIRQFYCFRNNLEGSIPLEFFDMEALTYAYLNDNNFTSSLPTQFTKLTRLVGFWIMRNSMTGPLPTGISQISDLTDLRIHGQTITGTLPADLFSLRFLERFDAYDTLINGTIPQTIGLMTRLAVFRIQGTDVTGTIPAEIGSARVLSSVWLHDTLLAGSIPPEMCQLTFLRELLVDCLEEGTSGEGPEVSDPFQCATACCDRMGQNCRTTTSNNLAPAAFPGTRAPTPSPTKRTFWPTIEPNPTPIGPPPISAAPVGLPTTSSPTTATSKNQRLANLQQAIDANPVVNGSSAELLSIQLSELVGKADDPSASPQIRAASWVILEDDADGEELRWRYALATLFYATNGNNWTNNDGWLTESNSCDWYGASCNQDGQIETLTLEGNNLDGPLLDEVNLLQHLVSLYLSQNKLNSELPSLALGSLANLHILFVDTNQLTGQITEDLRLNGKLDTLFIQHNNITGNFPVLLCPAPGEPQRLRYAGLDCDKLRCFCCNLDYYSCF